MGRRLGCARSAAALRPLWQGAHRLILNGDIAEIHHPAYRAAAARELLRLQTICDRDAVGLTVLSGNHDPYLTDRRHLMLAGGQVLVTHGDVLHPAVAPWSAAAPRMLAAQTRARAQLDADERDGLEGRLWASQRAAIAEWDDVDPRGHARTTVASLLAKPTAVAKLAWYWMTIPGVAASFARQYTPDARFVVIGHTHRAGVWRRGERVVLNTGSYGFLGRPHAVVIEDGAISMWRVLDDGERYRYDTGPVARFVLQSGDHPMERAA